MKLIVIPGEGRAYRSENAIAFSPDPSPEITSIIQRSDSLTLFQQLATLVVSSEFKHSPFMVLRLTSEPAMFLFGDLGVSIDGETLNGKSATTWIERPIEGSNVLEVGNLGEIAAFSDCDLISGTIGCAGLRAGPGDNRQTTNDYIPPSTDTVEPSPLEATPATAAIPEELEEDRDLEAHDELQEHEDLQEHEEAEEEFEDFDPLAGPSDVDLEAIGTVIAPIAVSAPEDSSQSASDDEADANDQDLGDVTIPPDLVDSSDEADVEGLSEPATKPVSLRAAPTAIPTPSSKTDSAGPGIRQAPTSLGSPNISEPTRPQAAMPEPLVKTGAGSLRVDDGQVLTIEKGIYVGRYPSKKGLPEGFGELVIQGEEISRVHWALTVEASGAVAIEDLGSTSGTTTIGPDGTEQPLANQARRIIGSGTKILFGNRWAVFER